MAKHLFIPFPYKNIWIDKFFEFFDKKINFYQFYPPKNKVLVKVYRMLINYPPLVDGQTVKKLHLRN
tara:strand:+ start:161 stop:361 length:201 start_codon:yes stop_codon:yes gene_type:complete